MLFLFCAGALFIFQSLLFIVALRKKNNGVADIGWGIGFIIIAWQAFHYFHFRCDFAGIFKGYEFDIDFLLLFSLIVIWGLRLSIYLLIRNWNKPEDWRYAKWRQEWGKSFYIRSYLQVFFLQGFFMLIIGSPIILAAQDSHTDAESYTILQFILMVLGLILWLIGFFFQAVGDYQLFVFKKDISNKGRVMRYGVWQYTRHPNYFGESAMWWGIFFISSVSAWDVTGLLLRVVSPLLITFMLLRVSGVTMLESKYKGNQEYEDYQMNTSSFIPMPNKKRR